MHTLALLLSLLTTTLTIHLTTAIPLANTDASPSSTPTPSAAAAAAAIALPDRNTCPGKKSKQCCTSLSEVQTGVLESVGEIIPLLNGIQLTSLVGLSCRAMSHKQTKADCGDVMMCCDAPAGELSEQNILQTRCEEFNIAKGREMGEMGEMGEMQDALDLSPSSAVVASGSAVTPMPTPRR